MTKYAVIYRPTGEVLSLHSTRREAESAADGAHPAIARYVGVEFTGEWYMAMESLALERND